MISRQIVMFYRDGDPECQMAIEAMSELYAENPNYVVLNIMKVDDTLYPDADDKAGYKYEHVPAFFDEEKHLLYQSFAEDTHEHMKKKIRAIFDLAME